MGGLGVVVTLVYLAIQVRQNSSQLRENAAATRAATYQDVMTVLANVNLEIVKSPDLAAFNFISSEELAQLSPTDQKRARGLHLTVMRAQQHLYLQYKAGLIDKESWDTHAMGLARVLSTSGARELWESFKEGFAPDFVAEVESLITRRQVSV